MMGKTKALKALKQARRIEVHAYMETLGPRMQTTATAERRKAAKRRQKLTRP